jgi:hypothetical protein
MLCIIPAAERAGKRESKSIEQPREEEKMNHSYHRTQIVGWAERALNLLLIFVLATPGLPQTGSMPMAGGGSPRR